MKKYISKEFEQSITVLKVNPKTLLVDRRATSERELRACWKYGTNLGISLMRKSVFAVLYKAYGFKPVNSKLS